MTNQNEHPDLEHVFDVTKGYCEKHGHTAFACVKCAAESQTDAPSSDLSTIAELHKLRAENERLQDDVLERGIRLTQILELAQQRIQKRGSEYDLFKLLEAVEAAVHGERP